MASFFDERIWSKTVSFAQSIDMLASSTTCKTVNRACALYTEKVRCKHCGDRFPRWKSKKACACDKNRIHTGALQRAVWEGIDQDRIEWSCCFRFAAAHGPTIMSVEGCEKGFCEEEFESPLALVS